MAGKQPLGKGLSALFGEMMNDDYIEEKTVAVGGLDEINIDLIDNNPNQPRKEFNEIALKELASSIEKHGVIQPIVLLENEGRYIIIAGERRFRASKLAGKTSIPAVVRKIDKNEAKILALIENLQREDLNPIESAEAIKELMESNGLTQEEVAVKIGKSRPNITNTLRLLQLDPEVRSLVRANRLTAGHARALVVVDDVETQKKFALKACDNKMSVRDLEMQVKLYFSRKKIPAGPRKKQPLTAEMKEMLNNMKRIFGTKVKAIGNESKGRIYIDYYNNDDLQRIFELMDMLKKDINNEQ